MWPARSDDAVVGKDSVQCKPAVKEIAKFWAPPLHVLLGAVQIFVVTLLERKRQKIDEGDETALEKYGELVAFFGRNCQ